MFSHLTSWSTKSIYIQNSKQEEFVNVKVRYVVNIAIKTIKELNCKKF